LKEGVMIKDVEDGIAFCLGDKELLVIKKNGDILVKGDIITNDVETVYAVREIIKQLEKALPYVRR